MVFWKGGEGGVLGYGKRKGGPGLGDSSGLGEGGALLYQHYTALHDKTKYKHILSYHTITPRIAPPPLHHSGLFYAGNYFFQITKYICKCIVITKLSITRLSLLGAFQNYIIWHC